MTVISISIEESSEQIVSGIPKTIAVTTNLPSNIFYTLDGSTPNLFSNIYTGVIYLPTDKLSITLKVFASDGLNESTILTEQYETNLEFARLSHSAVNVPLGTNMDNLYPYGTNSSPVTGDYLNTAGITVSDSDSAVSNGFDSEGNANAFTTNPFNSENYSIKYDTSDAQGQTGVGVGNLPANVTFENESEIPESTEQFTATFDPRAFVIFQDYRNQNPDDPPQINRQFFSSSDVRDGNAYFSSASDSMPISGSFLRQHYNPTHNTMTYYYFDSWTNKWLISTQPYVNNNPNAGSLDRSPVGGKHPGSRYVYEWVPFQRRVLF